LIATEQNRVHVVDPVQKILATTNRLQKMVDPAASNTDIHVQGFGEC